MNPGSNTESYPAYAPIGLRENPGKNLNQVTCPDRESNPGHLVSRIDVLTVTPQPHHIPPSNVSGVSHVSRLLNGLRCRGVGSAAGHQLAYLTYPRRPTERVSGFGGSPGARSEKKTHIPLYPPPQKSRTAVRTVWACGATEIATKKRGWSVKSFVGLESHRAAGFVYLQFWMRTVGCCFPSALQNRIERASTAPPFYAVQGSTKHISSVSCAL
ncbi:hypothetical protein ANN_23233 [Periplaneta americana]|uniref:Uncharacterized protein n=1 Tax=Periplaneta americana TaxID=6978 RepID=A0ABQ8SKM0_PERAM|nr:hypothetical protein ANN_23233 [Periplaneta americana]